MKTQRYIVEIEMPDGDIVSPGWLEDLVQTDLDIEDEGRAKVSVRAVKDLALTWEDIKLIDGLITEMAFSEPNDSTEWYQELANRFNEQRKK